MNIKVKPLEWEETQHGFQVCCTFGYFDIEKDEEGSGYFLLTHGDYELGWYESITEAKESAQEVVHDVVMQLIEVT